MVTVQLKGNPWNLTGSIPEKGKKAPPIEGVDADLKNRSLSEFQGKKKIICFVPSLDTPVCSESARKFNKKIQSKENVVVLYLSFDLPFALKRACSKEDNDLKHLLLLSLFKSKKPAEDYGVLIQNGPLSGLCARAVFVLDENDITIYSELVTELSHEPNYEKALSQV